MDITPCEVWSKVIFRDPGVGWMGTVTFSTVATLQNLDGLRIPYRNIDVNTHCKTFWSLVKDFNNKLFVVLPLLKVMMTLV